MKVKDVVDNKILDDSRFTGIKNYTIEIVDDLKEDGLFIESKRLIKLKRQSPVKMDKTLNHEIQHALDVKTGATDKDGKSHNLRSTEQTTKTNELLFQAEKLMRRGQSREQIIKYFDTKINQATGRNNPDAKAVLKRAKDAKTLFLKYLDEGRKVIV